MEPCLLIQSALSSTAIPGCCCGSRCSCSGAAPSLLCVTQRRQLGHLRLGWRPFPAYHSPPLLPPALPRCCRHAHRRAEDLRADAPREASDDVHGHHGREHAASLQEVHDQSAWGRLRQRLPPLPPATRQPPASAPTPPYTCSAATSSLSAAGSVASLSEGCSSDGVQLMHVGCSCHHGSGSLLAQQKPGPWLRLWSIGWLEAGRSRQGPWLHHQGSRPCAAAAAGLSLALVIRRLVAALGRGPHQPDCVACKQQRVVQQPGAQCMSASAHQPEAASSRQQKTPPLLMPLIL
jgi:hypothetical protein